MLSINPNLLLTALKTKPSQGEVKKPGDTGDDNALPPDPGYMGQTSPYMEVAAKKQAMPFPDNHNPDMDFVNRWPSNLPPAGIMNDLRPQIETGPNIPLPANIQAIVNGLKGN